MSRTLRPDGGPAFPQPYPPRAFEKAMVFVDGTNFLNRLREANLRSHTIRALAEAAVLGRELARIYFYTTSEKLERAKEIHGTTFTDGCRVVLGDSVPLGNGKFREKGVDALLVADLVYHAAQKNCTYAVVVSNDSDFAHAIKRVEDFGCNTGVVAIGVPAPERLQQACDDYHFVAAASMVEYQWASEVPPAQESPGA
jgi:uncharacterized LabA/DUF88 family protein